MTHTTTLFEVRCLLPDQGPQERSTTNRSLVTRRRVTQAELAVTPQPGDRLIGADRRRTKAPVYVTGRTAALMAYGASTREARAFLKRDSHALQKALLEDIHMPGINDRLRVGDKWHIAIPVAEFPQSPLTRLIHERGLEPIDAAPLLGLTTDRLIKALDAGQRPEGVILAVIGPRHSGWPGARWWLLTEHQDLPTILL